MQFSRYFGLSVLFVLFAAPSAFAASIDNGLIKSNAYHTDHFSIEFSDLLLDQTDDDNNGLPDIVDTVADAAEYSRDVILGDLNYSDPMAGTSRDLIIIMDDREEYLTPGALGVTSLLSNGDPYIAVNPWMSNDYLQITVGHEYFHAVQFGYGADFAYTDQGANWAEATAVWMEDQEYDDNNDYVNYLPEFFDYVDYSVFASIIPSGTLFQYGAAIWPRFLSEYFSDDIIQSVWETYVDSSEDYDDDRKLYNAVDQVIQEEGEDLRTVFRNFTLWNLDLSQYDEGGSYPGAYVLEGVESTEYQQVDQEYAPALFGTNYLYFQNAARDDDFYFHVVKPEGVSFAVTLVPYDADSVNLSKKQSVILDQNETMDSVLQLNDLKNADGVFAVVSPLDTAFTGAHESDFDEGYLYDYMGSYGGTESQFAAQVDAAGSGSSANTTDGGKEGEAVTQSDGGVRLPDELTLNVFGYDEDSVSFSWNRLTDADIAGYELRYGTKSGSYSESENVEHPYVTTATIARLDEGTKYYFELVAVDASGDTVGSSSSEVVVTPEQWLFSDVSFMDDHYDAIAALTDMGVFTGYANGSFKPENTINRAELLKILVEGREIDPSVSTYKNCFTDVGTEWYAKYVCYAEAQGWVQGYSDGSFRPGNAVNKVEALKILFQVYEAGVDDGKASAALSYSDLSRWEWYAAYVEQASALGILEEDSGTDFNPGASRTRGEMAEELYRYLVVEGLVE